MSIQTQLEAYYAPRFPAGVRMSISDVTRLSDGEVYRFTVNYTEGDASGSEQRILKCYTPDVSGADRALKERHALHKLHEIGYPVPRPSIVELNHDVLGKPFVVMERISGFSLGDAMASADAERRDALIQLFTGLLLDLHDLGAEVLVPNLPLRDEHTLNRREVHNLRTALKATGRDELQPVVDWLYERRETVPCARPAVTHRHYHPDNVLLTDESWRNYTAYVLDWAWQIGDPRYDLGATLTFLDREGQHALRDAVLAEYERRSGQPVEQLAYFEVLATTYWLLEISAPNAPLPSEGQVRAAADLIRRHTGIGL